MARSPAPPPCDRLNELDYDPGSLYRALKSVHVGCVALSATGFAIRGALAVRGTLARSGRWIRIAPHVIDTALLASALGLAWVTGQWPFRSPWLTSKLLGLFVYIGLGSFALRHAGTPRVRALAWLAALAVLAWIASVAITRRPGGFLPFS
jgi:uncharacterized membrane protein SirB2